MALPKIPIDMKALAKAGELFQGESSASTRFKVLVDSTTSPALVVAARKVLACEPGAAEVSVASFGAELPPFDQETNLSIVVAGSSPQLGRFAEIALWSKAPCVFLVEDAAALLAAVAPEDAVEIARAVIEVNVHDTEHLARELAQWCIRHLPEQRLALGAAFVALRRHIALDLTRQTALENAAIAAVFFLPGADLPVLTLNQCKLLYQLAIINHVPLTRERLIEAAVVVAAAFGLRGFARSAQKRLRPLAWLARGGVSFGATMTLGHLAYEFYRTGGSLAGLPALLKERLA